MFHKPVQDLSIVIPAYNEASRIQPTLLLLREYIDKKIENTEVIIVDDGSKDNTFETVQLLIRNWPEFNCIQLSKNQGKGAAIAEGVRHSNKTNLLFMDADCSTDLNTIELLFPYLSEKSAIVIGSRSIKGAKVSIHQNFLREFSAKFFNLWIQFCILPGLWDTQCGFKFFKTSLAKIIFSDLFDSRFGFDMEVLYKAKKLGYLIQEKPVHWKNVAGTTVNPIRDGFKMALHVLWLRFNIK